MPVLINNGTSCYISDVKAALELCLFSFNSKLRDYDT